ncbi:MAG: hypothetical protein ACLSA6_03200 [Holdemania massiliensis]
MNTRWENALYRLGSWLLIDMAIALGYWQMGGWKILPMSFSMDLGLFQAVLL